MSLAMSYSMPVLILSGSASAFVVPQKFGPGQAGDDGQHAGLDRLAVDGAAAAVLPCAAGGAVVAGVVADDSFLSLPHADRTSPTAIRPADMCFRFIDLPWVFSCPRRQ